MEILAKKQVIEQSPFTYADPGKEGRFEALSDFLDRAELGVRSLVRVMVQAYAEDEFLRYIGAWPYERTPRRKDWRSGNRRRTLEIRFGRIEDLRLPRARRAGTNYSAILARYRRQDRRIEEIVSEMFLRGVSTRKVGKISHLLWRSEVSPAQVSKMIQRVKKELIRWLNRPITKRFTDLIIDGAYFKVRRKRISSISPNPQDTPYLCLHILGRNQQGVSFVWNDLPNTGQIRGNDRNLRGQFFTLYRKGLSIS